MQINTKRIGNDMRHIATSPKTSTTGFHWLTESIIALSLFAALTVLLFAYMAAFSA